MIADSEGLLPMHYAALRSKSKTDNVEVVQYLLEANPDGNIMNSKEFENTKLTGSAKSRVLGNKDGKNPKDCIIS